LRHTAPADRRCVPFPFQPLANVALAARRWTAVKAAADARRGYPDPLQRFNASRFNEAIVTSHAANASLQPWPWIRSAPSNDPFS
jgi:hypothetical protein